MDARYDNGFAPEQCRVAAEGPAFNVQKAFPLRTGQFMTLRMNVFNLLNANTITARTMASGANFLRTTAILQPRIAELSVSYRFQGQRAGLRGLPDPAGLKVVAETDPRPLR